ncbi:tRNA modification GTPase [Tautonia plasticadhaerens]|uniref:tRNA modification GTPase MnmE n=1 Tax=Tautonia plasticadhaerens TaxID=2527974 RepID=A0A518GZQ8_9BACT|nr:tRNA modification GTPase [Tautonia plasticadhaerens]QDV34067.1 tRNA modification GTPase MnmE [Tautonia plasticadhaerens]
MAHLDPSDTIAAIASPPGPAVRGLVRLSGEASRAIALGVFRPPGGREPSPGRPSWTPGTIDLEGRPLDASLVLWPGVRTYTGQPMAEIHSTGSPPLLRLVLGRCLGLGARLAEPGEFTLRAFLSGRIDLTQAEAVLAVIDSRSPAQVEAALSQLAGGLAGPIDRLRDRLIDTLAHLEAGLDFVDEADVDPIGRRMLAGSLARNSIEVAALADRLRGRDRPSGLPRVVLVGPPNAGKSRLFNALVGADLALVSPVAGTTRDYLSAPIRCDGLEVELIDTAGIDDAVGPIEAEAQALRAAQAAGAELLLDCRSADAPPSLAPPDGRPRLLVWTKADRGPGEFPEGAVATSAETGLGLGALRLAIASSIRSRSAEEDPTGLTSARCRDGLSRASAALGRAAEAIRLESGDELVAVDLRDAVEELGRVIGAEIDDAILDRIFRRFCIGK